MDARRPRVALHITPRLFRDALARALGPHMDVVVAPESEPEYQLWQQSQPPFDAAIVSGVVRVIDSAGVVIEVPPAHGGSAPIGTVRGDCGRTINSLGELLELLPRSA